MLVFLAQSSKTGFISELSALFLCKSEKGQISGSVCLGTPHQYSVSCCNCGTISIYFIFPFTHSLQSSHGDEDRYDRNRWVSFLGSVQNLGRLLQGRLGRCPWQRPRQQCCGPRAAGAAAAWGGSAGSAEGKVTELTTRCCWWWHCTIAGTHIATSAVLQKLWLGEDERLEMLSLFWGEGCWGGK